MDILPFITSGVLVAIFVVIGVCLSYEQKLSVLPVPTLPWIKRNMIKALKKHVHDAEHVQSANLRIAELGSGWGGLVFSLLRIFPRASVAAFELSPFPYWVSKLRGAFVTRAVFRRADFFEEDLSDYDVIVFYLTPKLMPHLAGKLAAAGLKPGTIIISNAFELPGFDPVDVLETKILVTIRVYVYKIAAGSVNPAQDFRN